jgi:hypothetical protein
MDALLLHQKRTGEVPPALQNKPSGDALDVDFYLHAFFFLSGFRPAGGFGLSPIPYANVSDYAMRVGYTNPVDFFFLADVIRALDAEYMRWAHDKSERDAKMRAKKPVKR